MVVKVKVRVKVKKFNCMANKMNPAEGMRIVLDMVKSKYVAERMEGTTSFTTVLLSAGVNHNIYNGKPYYYSARQVEELQAIITQLGADLMQVNITQEPQREEDSPLCYGEDMVSKFKVLGKVIKLPYLIEEVLGKTARWRKMHLSDKRETKYYNQFTDAELEMINEGIHEIGLKVSEIQLEQGERSEEQGARSEGEEKCPYSDAELDAYEEQMMEEEEQKKKEETDGLMYGIRKDEWMRVMEAIDTEYSLTEEKIRQINLYVVPFVVNPDTAGVMLRKFKQMKRSTMRPECSRVVHDSHL